MSTQTGDLLIRDPRPSARPATGVEMVKGTFDIVRRVNSEAPGQSLIIERSTISFCLSSCNRAFSSASLVPLPARTMFAVAVAARYRPLRAHSVAPATVGPFAFSRAIFSTPPALFPSASVPGAAPVPEKSSEEPVHIPVMLGEVMNVLVPAIRPPVGDDIDPSTYPIAIDGTFGMGGHAMELLRTISVEYEFLSVCQFTVTVSLDIVLINFRPSQVPCDRN